MILFKIKNLSLKLLKTVEKLKKDQEKRPQDKNIRDRMEFVQNIIDELDALRDKTVKMDIKEKRYGVFVKVPKSKKEMIQKVVEKTSYNTVSDFIRAGIDKELKFGLEIECEGV